MDGSHVFEDSALDRVLVLLSAMRSEEGTRIETELPIGRHELSDEEWALVAPFLPSPKPLGRRPKPNRQMLNVEIDNLAPQEETLGAQEVPDRVSAMPTKLIASAERTGR